MAKKATVQGEYLERNASGTVDIVPYEEDFLLDDSIESIEQARQVVKRGLIIYRLSKQKNFKRVRTCQVISFESVEEKAENSELDQLLTKAAQLGCIPVNVNNYRRPDYKIKALQNAIAKAEERAKAPKKQSNVEDQGYVD